MNTNGELVRHAVLQWGETPYAIGKSSINKRINSTSVSNYFLKKIVKKLF